MIKATQTFKIEIAICHCCGFDKSHVVLGITRIKEYRTIYLKKYIPMTEKRIVCFLSKTVNICRF